MLNVDAPLPNPLRETDSPSEKDVPLALVLGADCPVRSRLAEHIGRQGFLVLSGETLEELSHLEVADYLAIRLVGVCCTGAEGGDLVETAGAAFSLVPMVLVGAGDGSTGVDWCDGAMVVASLGEACGDAELDQAIARAQRFARVTEEHTRRHFFCNQLNYIEEPVARIIHDLNNQITGLKGGVDLLSYSLTSVSDPTIQEKFGRYLSQFIQPSLSQIEAMIAGWRRMRESRAMPIGSVELTGVVRRAVALAAPPVRWAWVALEVQGNEISLTPAEVLDGDAGTGVWAAVNEEQIALALGNILRNAFEAVEGLDEPRVLVRISEEPDDMVGVQVLDSGEGISPDNAMAVWRSFFSTKKASNVGLGLSVAKQLVDKHQGQVDLVDSPLGGAGIRVRLPAASAPGGQSASQ